VIAPYVIAGQTVVQAVERPTALSFLELATRRDYRELQIEEMEVQPGSRLAGSRLDEAHLRQEMGITVVAVKKSDGKMIYNAFPDVQLERGDILICLGHRDQLARLSAMVGDTANG